ncbi:MAG: GNAT family N-acetyltransferase [Acidimicrobiia bacterium]|nr:GNAT family N-acetyltransferase [Acidimicrobiia bacterium]
MSIKSRPATPADVPAIVAFTTGTFVWGDYVPDEIANWIETPESVVMVATDGADLPIAMGRCRMLSPTEGWLHAARVHPDHRGKGIAGEMAVILTDWAREQGALVTRLMIEDTNESSRRHIAKTGFRRTTTVHRASADLQDRPTPTGNGRVTTPTSLRARPGRRSEAGFVVSSWLSGDTGRAIRGLVGDGWAFHRLTETVIRDTAHGSMLWDIGGATALTREVGGQFDVDLLDTTESEAADVIRTLMDLAIDHGSDRFGMWLADLPWLIDAANRNECDTFSNGIYAMTM